MQEDRPFDLSLDRAAGRLHWTLRGYWQPETVGHFAHALHAAVEGVGAPPWPLQGFGDTSDFPVQSVGVSQALSGLSDASGLFRHRVAIVVGGMMNKLQAERTFAGKPNIAAFLNRSEAEAWLAADPMRGHRFAADSLGTRRLAIASSAA